MASSSPTPTSSSSSNHKSSPMDITSSSSSFLSLVDPIKYIQKRKWNPPTTTTSSLLEAFSPLATTATTTSHGTTKTNSATSTNIPTKGDSDNVGTNTIVDSLFRSTYIKPWLEYYQEVPRKIDLFPDLTKNLEDINHSISQKLDDLVRGNTQVLLLGAALGAAITAGVALGVGSVLVFVWNRYSENAGHGDEVNDYGARRRFFFFLDPFFWKRLRIQSRPGRGHDQQQQQQTGHQKLFEIIVGNGEKNGNSSPILEVACRQCLDSITVQLGKKSLGWCHVLRITAYLVQEDHNAIISCAGGDDRNDDDDDATARIIFRKVLKEYPYNTDAQINVVYVKGLENKQSMVQVETFVSCKTC